MLKRFACLSIVTLALATPAGAAPIIDDDFEGYSDVTAMQAQWLSTTNSTTSTYLIDPLFPNQPYPLSPTPGYLDGQAALFDGTIGAGSGTVNKWSTPFVAKPTATENVLLSVDIGFDHQDNDPTKLSNKKLSVGLRYTGTTATENIIELGFWNQIPTPPSRLFAHRTVSFASGNPAADGGWAYYGLPTNYDQLAEMDHSGNSLTNGKGFHRFSAEVSLSSITYKLDLFADGINNSTGQPGIDATDVVNAVMTTNGFNDLRFGIPSANGSSANPLMAIDNVLLTMVDVTANPDGDADFDDDDDVDGRDFLLWQRGYGINDGTALRIDGDATGEGNVDGADLAIWQGQYAEVAPLDADVTAVPEPSTCVLLLAACSSLCVRKRR